MLYKLVDLLALLRSPDFPVTLAGVAARAKELGLADETFFALTYLDALYPRVVPRPVLETLRPESVTYLDEVRDDRGEVSTWSAPIRQRFFDARRALRLADPARVVPGEQTG